MDDGPCAYALIEGLGLALSERVGDKNEEGRWRGF